MLVVPQNHRDRDLDANSNFDASYDPSQNNEARLLGIVNRNTGGNASRLKDSEMNSSSSLDSLNKGDEDDSQ